MYQVVWCGRGGVTARGGFRNQWNFAISLGTALTSTSLPKSELPDPPLWPLLHWATLAAMMEGKWWFHMKTLPHKKVQNEERTYKPQREEDLKKKVLEDHNFSWPFYTVPAKTTMTADQAEHCERLLTAWAEESRKIQCGTSTYKFTTNGEMELSTKP